MQIDKNRHIKMIDSEVGDRTTGLYILL